MPYTFPANLTIEEPADQDVLNYVWSQAKNILSVPLFPHFTDHSIEHSKRIVALTSSLIEGEVNLTNDEKFILLCAIALHDVGMQVNRYIEDSEAPLNQADLETIRENHHEYSHRYIVDEHENLGLSQKLAQVEFIAKVAKNHRITDLLDVEDEYIGGNLVRIKLLSAIIRLADCLDCDFNRVNIERLLQLNIEIRSKAFWYCHHHVQSVHIENGKVKLDFKFPKEYENAELPEIIKGHVTSEITNQINDLYDIIGSYGIHFHRDLVESVVRYSEMPTTIPDDVKNYISNEFVTNTEDNAIVAFRKRSDAIDSILVRLQTHEAYKNLCFFGGISSTILCDRNTIKRLSKWLLENPDAYLYMCYEAGAATEGRVRILRVPNPADHMRIKEASIIKSQLEYPEDVQGRVCYIPLSMPLNLYIILLDDDMYWNSLTEQRSSEATTLQAKNTPAGNKVKEEHLRYIIAVLSQNDATNQGVNDLIKKTQELLNKTNS